MPFNAKGQPARLSVRGLWLVFVGVVLLTGCASVFAVRHADDEAAPVATSSSDDAAPITELPQGDSLWSRQLGTGAQVVAVSRDGDQAQLAVASMGGHRCITGQLSDTVDGEELRGNYQVVTAGDGAQGAVAMTVTVTGSVMTTVDTSTSDTVAEPAIYERAEADRYARNEGQTAVAVCTGQSQ